SEGRGLALLLLSQGRAAIKGEERHLADPDRLRPIASARRAHNLGASSDSLPGNEEGGGAGGPDGDDDDGGGAGPVNGGGGAGAYGSGLKNKDYLKQFKAMPAQKHWICLRNYFSQKCSSVFGNQKVEPVVKDETPKVAKPAAVESH
ncbi:unnamed protein product, partial [Urochloa humidicola]